jgi:hypothetical protein
VPAEGRVAPGTGRLNLLVTPGTYTVKLNVGGTEHTRTVEVRKDPNTGGTVAEIEAQNRALAAIRNDMNAGAAAVGRIERVRVQIAALKRQVEDAEVRRAVDALEAKLVELESNLVDLRQTGQGQDGVRWGSRLLSKLSYMTGGLASNDFRPTDQQVEVQGILNTELRTHLNNLESIFGTDLMALNTMLRTKNIPNVVGATRIVP